MLKNNNKFYITTAILYSNAEAHIGHAYEFFLADVIARYQRLQEKDTYFLTGMDEHGLKIGRSARENNMEVQDFVDEMAEQAKELHQLLNISYNQFIRTSDKKIHWPGAQTLWKELVSSNDIYKKKYNGLYCIGCERFITEKELINNKCPEHDKEPENIEEENYFFKLSKYNDQIKNLIKSNSLIISPVSARNEILSLLESGLEDVSFSRKKESVLWGIPVPEDKTQLMYVWCDALSNYITALGYGRKNEDNFKKFWPADIQVIGKGILRFHAGLWPGMLLSAGLPFPKEILVHSYLTINGKKISKSIGNVINPKEYIHKYGTDAVRYYLGREITPFEDGDFSKEKFIKTYNANLANGLGNLISRILKMANDYFEGSVNNNDNVLIPTKRKKEATKEKDSLESWAIPYLIDNKFIPDYHGFMEKFEINRAADVIWKLIKELDGYITDYEPYKLIRTDKEKTEVIIWNVLYGLFFVGKFLGPFMPEIAEKINNLLGVKFDTKNIPKSFKTNILEKPLFKKID